MPWNGRKPTREKTAAPSGRGSARQPLSELRRIVDADRHRIRRKFIGMRNKGCRREPSISHPHRLRGKRRNDLVANALAAVVLNRSLFVRHRLAVLYLRLLVM